MPGDLLAPSGDLTLSLFPGEDEAQVEARLDNYISEGADVAQASNISTDDTDSPRARRAR